MASAKRQSMSRATLPPPVPTVAPARGNRNAVLDAAEEVVLRDGIGRLTLEAVARAARLSKSGLLHHFRSKDSLLDALVHRQIDEWIEETRQGYEATPPGRGRAVRAMLATCLSSTEHWTDAMRRGSTVLVAALVANPKYATHIRKTNAHLRSRFDGDELPMGVCDLVQLAVNGIWFDWILGLSEWTPDRLAEVRGTIAHLVSHPPSSGQPDATKKKAKAKRAPARRTADRRTRSTRSSRVSRKSQS
jgi:AcrR family transcriptional regulator